LHLLLSPGNRRDTTNEYAALFVALIGEGANPQGVVNTSEGKVVRAFHRFTLVNQNNTSGDGNGDLTKGRTREAGAVKISCARQDPNARNCHGYRKFVKRTILEDPARGFLKDDTIVIKYTIELVVSSGGALSRSNNPSKAEPIKVPPTTIGKDLADLFYSGGWKGGYKTTKQLLLQWKEGGEINKKPLLRWVEVGWGEGRLG
jgi:speckle-type POZ protein